MGKNVMRLSQDTIKTINTLAQKHFGNDCEVYIFGSRVDDAKRGGDIDIYIETSLIENIFDAKLEFLTALHKAIGEQKIDLVVKKRESKQIYPIYESAKNAGVKI